MTFQQMCPARVIRAVLLAIATTGTCTAHASTVAGSGLYLSDAVELVLRADGTFAVQELGGARQARGRFRAEGDALTFVSGYGDVGHSHFPLACRVAATFGGFVFRPGQPGCRAFEGLSFRNAQ